MLLKNANVLFGDKFWLVDLKINDITGEIEEAGTFFEDDNCIELNGSYVLPGLFDVHTHGGNGYDFNSAKNLEEMQKIIDFYIKNGVTSVLPTVMTDDENVIKRQLNLIAELSKSNPCIKGIHLEGPFLGVDYKGAQPEEYLQPLLINKFNEFQKAANGLINYITISPELAGAVEFIQELIKQNVYVSLGHSSASFSQAKKAIENGAKGFTHVMNAMKPIDHHNPSIATYALYSKNTYCEIILDGIHVHPNMVEFIRNAKTNDYIIGITDSLMPAGLPNGDYFLGATPIIVVDGDCKIKGTNTRAGSTLKAIDGFFNFIKFTNQDLISASKVWSTNPAKALNMEQDVGTIRLGAIANLIIIKDNQLEKVIYQGKLVN